MSYRKEKIEEMIKRIVSDLMLKEIKDPRIGFATITGVTLSSDKKHAKIGISVIGNATDRRKTIDGLRSASGFIQHRLGKGLRIRYTPEIEFFLDSSIADSVKMVAFLENLVHKDLDEKNDDDNDSKNNEDI